MIKIQNLKKAYKDCVALDTVSMHIRKGEFVAIIGASGSGKTTMLNIIGGLTVKENMCLTSQIKGKKVDEKELDQVLKLLGLEQKKDSFANELSGGQQQRVAIGRAILAHTDIILADEPTGNLDGENAENVMDILKALNKEGKTIVLVTHDLKIANYADRIIRLEQGKIV